MSDADEEPCGVCGSTMEPNGIDQYHDRALHEAYMKGQSEATARIIGTIERVRDEYRQDDDLESLAASGALSYALAAIQEDGNG